MRILTLALCGALLTTGVAVAAPTDRAALLDRLYRALPKVTEILPLQKVFSDDLREDLIAQNPGKEAAAGPIADQFGACVVKIFDTRDYAAAAVQAADKAGMTDAELLKIIAFYEDPEMKALLSKVSQALTSDEEPDLDPAAFARLEELGKDPAVERFSDLMQTSAGEIFKNEDVMDEIVVCAADMDAAVDDAGLAYDPDKIEVITEEEAKELEKNEQ